MGIKREKVVITRRARVSIKEIFEFIKNREQSIEKAHYVRQAIINKCYDLKNFAGYSTEIYLEEFPEKYCSVSIWNYVIIYITTIKEVKVLNVIHSNRHPESRKKIN